MWFKQCLRGGRLGLELGVLVVLAAVPGNPQTVASFDNLPVPFPDFVLPTREPFEYEGLIWEGCYIIRPRHGLADNFPKSGLRVGLVSGEFVAIAARRGIAYSEVRAIGGGKFTFLGANLTAGWRSGLKVTLEGISGGEPSSIKRVVIEPDGPRFIEVNFVDVDAVRIRSQGGEDAGLCNSPVCEPGPEVVVDDFTFTFDNPADTLSKAPSEALLASAKVTPAAEAIEPEAAAVEKPRVDTMAAVKKPTEVPQPPEPKATQEVESKPAEPASGANPKQIPKLPPSLAKCPETYFGAQVGAFRSENNATKLLERYASEFGAAQMHVRQANGAPFYTVVVGCYSSRKESTQLRETLSKMGIDNVSVHATVERLGQFASGKP